MGFTEAVGESDEVMRKEELTDVEEEEGPVQQEEEEDISEEEEQAPARVTYLEMIADAILTQKKKTGSSRVAISKHIRENYDLPRTFEDNLKKQLKKLVEDGKLYFDKVHKRSYKLSKKALAPAEPAAAAAAAQPKNKRQKTQ